MKKILLTVLALALVLSLGTAAFAVINGGTSATVTGKYIAADSQVISVELAWDSMEFIYTLTGSATKWNADDHQYEGDDLVGTWSGGAKTLTVTNHSNATVYASFDFTAKSGVNVTTEFTKDALALQNAENKPLNDRACKDSTAFSVTGGSVKNSGTIGSISVVLATTYDATQATAAELQAFLSNAVAHGVTDLSVKLADEINADMVNAIRAALSDNTATTGTVNLTLSGVTHINTAGSVNSEKKAQLLKSLSLPDVEYIGDNAFRYCPNLTSVSAPKLMTVGAYVFNNTGLTSVDFPWLSTAGNSAFSSNTALTSVNLPLLSSAEWGVFNGCTALTSISLPNATHVKLNAFLNCTALTTVDLPQAQQIYEGVFSGCTALTDLKLTSDFIRLQNQPFSGVDTTKIALTLYKNQKSKVSGTTWNDYTFKSIRYSDGGNHTVPTNAADYQTNWTTTPPTYGYYCSLCGAWVTTKTAVGDVSSMPNIFGAHLYYVDIDDGTVGICSIPDGNYYAPDNIRNDLDAVIQNCNCSDGDHVVLDITIPEEGSITEYCGAIKVVMEQRSNLTFSLILRGATSVPEEAFHNCYNLTTVTLPDATSIGDSAFYFCEKLTAVSAPKVTTVGEEPFALCGALTSVSLPEAITVGDFAFNACTALASIDLPKATTIGKCAFYHTALTSVSLPEAISLGSEAFAHCTALTTVDLPKVTTIERDAFAESTALTKVTLGATSSANIGDIAGNNNANIDLTLNAALSDEVYFGCYWNGMEKFKSITLDDGGNHSTPQDYEYQVIWNDLACTAELGHYCTYCGEWVKKELVYCTFRQGYSLHCLTAHFSGNIGAARMYTSDVGDLEQDAGPDFDAMYAELSGVRLILLNFECGGNSEDEMFSFLRSKLSLYSSIPCSLMVGNNELIEIPANALKDCTNLIAYTSPFAKKITGESAFSGCTSLKRISMPSLTQAAPYAFRGLTALVSVDLPKLETISSHMFAGCTSLTTLSFPSVTGISDNAFWNCTSLTRLAFGTIFPNDLANYSIGGVTTGNITLIVPIHMPGISAVGDGTAWVTEDGTRYTFKELVRLMIFS